MATITRQTLAGLSTLVRQPEEGDQPDRAVIFIHGWGADGSDLMDLSTPMASRFPKAIFYAPDGPEPCSANPMGRQWFSLDGDQASIDQGPDQAMPQLKELIDTVMTETGLNFDQIWLFGFSQGGMMALHTGMRLDNDLGGVMSFSGALLAPQKLEDEITSRPPALLVHGRDDQVVPFQALEIAQAVLSMVEVPVETLPREGLGHGIDPEGFDCAIDFMMNGAKT